MGWNMDLMEPVELDLNRSRVCSRCAFCAFLRLCLSSYKKTARKKSTILVNGEPYFDPNDAYFSGHFEELVDHHGGKWIVLEEGELAAICEGYEIRNYSAAKRHKRHKQGMGWNMDLMEPVKLDLNRSRACSRCAFCAFLRLCLSSYRNSPISGDDSAARSCSLCVAYPPAGGDKLPAVAFKYKLYHHRWMPMVPLKLRTSTKEVLAEGHVDSEASYSIFQMDAARGLGLNRADSKRRLVVVGDGRPMWIYVFKLIVEVAGQSFPAEIGFSERLGIGFNVIVCV
jgi:hypothetical protein